MEKDKNSYKSYKQQLKKLEKSAHFHSKESYQMMSKWVFRIFWICLLLCLLGLFLHILTALRLWVALYFCLSELLIYTPPKDDSWLVHAMKRLQGILKDSCFIHLPSQIINKHTHIPPITPQEGIFSVVTACIIKTSQMENTLLPQAFFPSSENAVLENKSLSTQSPPLPARNLHPPNTRDSSSFYINLFLNSFSESLGDCPLESLLCAYTHSLIT